MRSLLLRLRVLHGLAQQRRLRIERDALQAEIVSNQRLLLKLAGQGDEILAAVIAAVNGSGRKDHDDRG